MSSKPKLIDLLQAGSVKNIDIINLIQPTGRMKVGFAAHENPNMSKSKKTIYTDEDLVVVFEAIIQSRRLKWSEAIEKLMFNEIKRIARDLDEGDLAAVVRGFLLSRKIKEDTDHQKSASPKGADQTQTKTQSDFDEDDGPEYGTRAYENWRIDIAFELNKEIEDAVANSEDREVVMREKLAALEDELRDNGVNKKISRKKIMKMLYLKENISSTEARAARKKVRKRQKK